MILAANTYWNSKTSKKQPDFYNNFNFKVKQLSKINF